MQVVVFPVEIFHPSEVKLEEGASLSPMSHLENRFSGKPLDAALEAATDLVE